MCDGSCQRRRAQPGMETGRGLRSAPGLAGSLSSSWLESAPGFASRLILGVISGGVFVGPLGAYIKKPPRAPIDCEPDDEVVPVRPSPGYRAPNFVGRLPDGTIVSLDDCAGMPTVLVFFLELHLRRPSPRCQPSTSSIGSARDNAALWP